ncbi:predicted protein [Botrytis cinerea T4]|uniref:Uncharacterized protein n=1 Tax=Botryotinia fuckeliana (strain T4) TaxID=999810 RepID=G2XZJ8_BOTF4|nr:predicted protein [Botrytis cinerea T4]
MPRYALLEYGYAAKIPSDKVPGFKRAEQLLMYCGLATKFHQLGTFTRPLNQVERSILVRAIETTPHD